MYGGSIQGVQARIEPVTTDIDVINILCATDKPDLTRVGASTAIRTAGHPYAKRLINQAQRAKVSLCIMPGNCGRILHAVTQPALQFSTKPGDSAFLHDILHAGVLAILAITIITLYRDNRLHHRQDFTGSSIAEWRSQPGIRGRFAVGHTHTTTNQYCEAIQALAFQGSNKTNILGVHVNTVVTWKGDTDLELAWEIGRTINWLCFISSGQLHSLYLLAIDPEFVIGVAMGSKVLSNTMGDLFYLCLCTAGGRSGTSHHITIHIATGSQGREESFVDSMDGRA